MRLVEFLNENKRIDVIIKTLKRDCSIFLKEIKGSQRFLFRGIEDTPEIKASVRGDIFLRKSRISSGRKPLSMRQKLHDILNRIFYKKFGWNVRDGVFVTSQYGVADTYGHPWIFFPKGSYKYAWSPNAYDLFAKLPHHRYDELPLDIEEILEEELRHYKDNDLKTPINQYREISFNCEEYYLVNSQWQETDLKEILK